jgi:hypothetical protein
MITPFDRQAFFPETTPADWAPHESWLKPHAMDPDTGALRFPIQSYVVRTAHHAILIDTCVGNHKQRPNRPASSTSELGVVTSVLVSRRSCQIGSTL